MIGRHCGWVKEIRFSLVMWQNMSSVTYNVLTWSKTTCLIDGDRDWSVVNHTHLAWSLWRIWNNVTLHMRRIYSVLRACAFATSRLSNVPISSKSMAGISRKHCYCDIFHHTPNKSKYPPRTSASEKMHSAEGAQKSYCSGKKRRKWKEEGGEKEQ